MAKKKSNRRKKKQMKSLGTLGLVASMVIFACGAIMVVCGGLMFYADELMYGILFLVLAVACFGIGGYLRKLS